MKVNMLYPLLVFLSVLLGMGTFIESTNFIQKNIIKSNKEIIFKDQFLEHSPIKIIRDKHLIDTIIIDTTSYIFNEYISINKKEQYQSSLSKINNEAYFNLNPSILRWTFFAGGSLSIILSSSILIMIAVHQLVQKYKPLFNSISWICLILSIIVFIIFLLFSSSIQPMLWNGRDLMEKFGLIFNRPKYVTNWIIVPQYIVSIIPVIGILIINIAVYTSSQSKGNKSTLLKNECIYLKDKLNIFAIYLSFLVSIAVIGAGLQRDMIISQVSELDILYTKEMIIGHGFSFSLILALIFIPTSIYLSLYGKENLKDNEKSGGMWWQTGTNLFNNIKLFLSITLPFFSGIMQQIISGL